MPLQRSTKPPTWGELLLLLNTASNRPNDAAWGIYRYLRANYSTIGSVQARTLLAAYMQLPVRRPSRLHSCMLGVAVKISNEYSDFRFDKFLELWEYPDMLLAEDKNNSYAPDGQCFPALMVRTDTALRLYRERHTVSQSQPAGIPATVPMVAVKVWARGSEGHSFQEVKLVGPRGEEARCDIHRFPVRPSDVAGRLFEVMFRGHEIGDIRPSERKIATLFPPIIGYVSHHDREHNHYHIYDSLSRHFVAEAPRIAVSAGAFVLFSPVIPARDRFKSAIVQCIMEREEAREAFGTYEAEVTVVEQQRGFFSYRLLTPPRPTPEGTVTPEGTASLSTLPDILDTLRPGCRVRLLLFLTRRRDGTKQNYVAETEILDT